MKIAEKAVTFLNLGLPHNIALVNAAQSLADARNYLIYAKADFGGHREDAIDYINRAVDEIRAVEENGNH